MATATPTTTARRLRRSNLSAPGYARRRCGKGFIYLGEDGERITDNELVARITALGDMSREQVLACAARLLDRGFFRIGSEEYKVTNETFGLATMLKSHVTIDGETIRFDYIAKESKRRVQAIVDPEVAAIVGTLKRRRGGGEELLAYRRAGCWCDVRSPDINAYLKAATGRDISAKDFRTWGATVLAAVGLAVTAPRHLGPTARKRAIVRAVKEVAFYLGNTPTVARNSYIDPRVFDRYRDGQTIRLELVGADR